MSKYKNNLSYEKYMDHGLNGIHSNLGLGVYKRAGSDLSLKYTFDKELDYRVVIKWKKEPIYQFIVDRQFWHMSNRNDDDKKHMRRWADEKLEMIADAVKRGKEKIKEKSKEKSKENGK